MSLLSGELSVEEVRHLQPTPPFHPFKKENTFLCSVYLISIEDLVAKMTDPATGVTIKNRTHHLKVHHSCFVGQELVDWMLVNDIVFSRQDAVTLGNRLMEAGVIYHVSKQYPFKDENQFYKFNSEWKKKFEDKPNTTGRRANSLDSATLSSDLPRKVLTEPSLLSSIPATAAALQAPVKGMRPRAARIGPDSVRPMSLSLGASSTPAPNSETISAGPIATVNESTSSVVTVASLSSGISASATLSSGLSAAATAVTNPPPPTSAMSNQILEERFSDCFWKGWLRKRRQGAHGTKTRYVVVYPTEIQYYKEPETEPPAGVIPLTQVGILFDEKFTIITPDRIYTFWAEKERDHEVWSTVLSRVAAAVNK